MSFEPIVGIDLGTTFSLIAIVDERGPRVLRDASGDGRVPSVIAVSQEPGAGATRSRVGWEARNHAVENPLATVYSVKRLMGKSYDEIVSETPYLAYAVSPGPRGTAQVDIGGRLYGPEQISAMILSELKSRAETELGRPIRKAVVTVPAYFDDAQRQATRDAGAAAGLDVIRIVNEPTAAALAYGIGLRATLESADEPPTRSTRERGQALPMARCHEVSADPAGSDAASAPADGGKFETVAVYDLGGGTFDISILRIEGGVFQVLSTAGDTHLGGDDFDRVLIELVQRETREQFQTTIDSPASRQALRLLAEGVKVRLSRQNEATIELDLGGGRLYRRTIRREEFESLIGPLVERTLRLMRRALADARLEAASLSNVILVGGSTRVPLVRRRVEEAMGRPPYMALDPDEVVALGAAVHAAMLGQRPAAGLPPQHAATESSVAAAPNFDMLLLDVTPLSLGIETMGGAVGKLILRNTTIPCRASEMFTTFVDGQTAIKIHVLQGERELAKDCRSLADFELRGLPPMPAGIPKIEVQFLIDANGILNVSAREQRSGASAQVQVMPSRGLTRAEADRMVREGVSFGREDLNEHRRIDLVNQIEFDGAKTLQALKRVGHLLPAGEQARIEGELAALRGLARETTDLDALHQALERFGRSTMRLAEIGIAEALKTAQRT